MTRYPLQPLAAALHIELGGPPGNPNDDDRTHGIPALIEALHTNKRSIQRFRRQGLTARMADRLANRTGRHPSAIWPDWSIPDDNELGDVNPDDGLGTFDEADPDYFGDDPPIEDLDPADRHRNAA